MRTKRTLLNMAYALGSSLLLLLLGLVTRRLLVDNFGPQITTASQVVSQLFNFFSIAEFGVGSVISYRLYEQIAAKNEEKISKYMSMYKWAYRVVGLVIAGLALIGAAALRWIMPDVPAATAYTVYGLNVVSTLCSYFLITRRLMYTCTQQGYRCTQIDFCCNVLTSLAKIAVSLWFPNYVLYFSVTIFFNVTANLLIARRFRKDFPYVHDVKVTVNDFKDLGIFHDLRYFLVHRLSNTIYGSSDTIVTSRLGGSTQTTFLGNYNTISTSATDLGNKVMDSFAAAIGSIVYDKSAAANDHDKQVFWGMDLFSYLFASFVATAYFCLFQPFMASWMGEKWLLPLGFVLVFCLNEYVGWNHRMLGHHRRADRHRRRPLHHVGRAYPGRIPPVYARRARALSRRAGAASGHAGRLHGRQLRALRPDARRLARPCAADFRRPRRAQRPEPRRLWLGQRRRLPAPVRGQGGQKAAEKVTSLLGPLREGVPPAGGGGAFRLPPSLRPSGPPPSHARETNNVVIL